MSPKIYPFEFLYILFNILFLVHCVVSQWSRCSVTCGTGNQQRSVQIPAKYGGQQCSSQLTKSCSLKKCECPKFWEGPYCNKAQTKFGK